MRKGHKIPCPHCRGYIEHQEDDDGSVTHTCINCARVFYDIICHTTLCRRING